MKSQWECVLENLGVWEGSFTRLSPYGEIEADIPSLISLTGIDDNRGIHLSLIRHYPDAEGKTQPQEMSFDFNSPGAGAIFFETGAFSEGSVTIRSGVPVGAEFAFRHGDRRLRLIQQFDGDGKLYRQTLVRENRQNTTKVERPCLDIDTWRGLWRGEAVTLFPGNTRIERATSSQTVEPIGVEEVTIAQDIGGNLSNVTYHHSPELKNRWLTTSADPITAQIVLLPDGAYSYCPTEIHPGQPITLEVGWYIESNLRQRLIRRYNDRGEWLSLTFIQEVKLAA
jgi:hypothetical protein